MTSIIPIRNIYYMLSYAYDVLKQGDNVKLAKENFSNIYDLFGKIMVNGLNTIVKRGFNREYITVCEELPVLKGKININETLRKQSQVSGKLYCDFDELSKNVLFNQIIRTSIDRLIRYRQLDSAIRQDLVNIERFFYDVDIIRLKKSHFSNIRFQRNNSYYKLVIDICEMLYDEAIVNSKSGEIIFKDFITDKEMSNLYKKFIFNFYRKELLGIKVHSPIFQWDRDDNFDNIGVDLLPTMRTDIVLETKYKQLIMDAKYYSNSLELSKNGETKKLIAPNLYRIYSYINNSNFQGERVGMLVYPVVDVNLDLEYSIQGKIIYVKTLDLNKQWEEIYVRLREMGKMVLS